MVEILVASHTPLKTDTSHSSRLKNKFIRHHKSIQYFIYFIKHNMMPHPEALIHNLPNSSATLSVCWTAYELKRATYIQTKRQMRCNSHLILLFLSSAWVTEKTLNLKTYALLETLLRCNFVVYSAFIWNYCTNILIYICAIKFNSY